MLLKTILLVLFILPTTGFKTIAQVQIATPQELSRFFQSQTLFVKHGKPFTFYNKYIEKAAEKDWHITPYSMIEARDFDNKRQNNAYSFVILSDAVFTMRRQQIEIEVLNLILGSRGRGINDMPDLGSVPLCYKGDDEDAYLHKLPAILKFMQYQTQAMAAEQIKTPRQLLDYHNQFANEIKRKHLWKIYQKR